MLVLPSLDEGFGMPALEAMTIGDSGRGVERAARCPKSSATPGSSSTPTTRRDWPRRWTEC